MFGVSMRLRLQMFANTFWRLSFHARWPVRRKHGSPYRVPSTPPLMVDAATATQYCVHSVRRHILRMHERCESEWPSHAPQAWLQVAGATLGGQYMVIRFAVPTPRSPSAS
jgi:hypothetical protein